MGSASKAEQKHFRNRNCRRKANEDTGRSISERRSRVPRLELYQFTICFSPSDTATNSNYITFIQEDPARIQIEAAMPSAWVW